MRFAVVVCLRREWLPLWLLPLLLLAVIILIADRLDGIAAFDRVLIPVAGGCGFLSAI